MERIIRLADAVDAVNRSNMLNDFEKAMFRTVLQSVEPAEMTHCNHCAVVPGHQVGDVCIYCPGDRNESRSLVEIQKILDDKRGVAEVKFLKVFVDATGNGWFNYLLKTGGTMNASLKYLRNITPARGETKG